METYKSIMRHKNKKVWQNKKKNILLLQIISNNDVQ